MRLDPAEPDDRHLRVDQLRPNLKEHAVRAGASVLAAQAGASAISITTVVILARLLHPVDFGLVAMALPLVVFASVLRNFGLDIGAISREHLDHALANGLFWLALRLNLLMTAAFAALAPALAWFYHEPRLVGITLALSGGVLLLSAGAQPEMLLKRQMRFDLLALVTLAAAIFGAITALTLALLDAGYWSLVGQSVATFFTRTVLIWSICDWRPQFPRLGKTEPALRSMLASGRNLTGARLLGLSSASIDRVVVGWMAGPAILGFYENGRRLAFLALDNLYASLLDVAVAGFSRTGHDDARYRGFSRKAVQLVLAIILPLLAFLLVETRPVTLLLLGPQWSEAVPFARLLVVAALAQSLTRTLAWFYLSKDDTARQFRWFAVQAIVTVLAVALGATFGRAVGVASAMAIVAVLLTLPAIAYALRGSVFTAGDFGRAAGRPLCFALGAAGVLRLIESFEEPAWSHLIHCLATALIYAGIYLAAWIASSRGREELRQMVRLLVQINASAAPANPQAE